MINRPSKSQPTWIDVKAKLAPFDRTGLLSLVQDLYAAHKDNQVFLHVLIPMIVMGDSDRIVMGVSDA